MKIHTVALSILGLVITCLVSAQQGPLPQSPETNMAICSVALPATTATVGPGQQAKDFFSSLLNVSSWPPRWQCGVWTPFHGWLYIISDAAIGVSYFLIPLILLFFLQKQRLQKSFRVVVVLFVVFILACGLTHIVDAVIFWWPAYRLSALVRFATAVVSAGTVLTLVKITPTVLKFKSPESLEKLVAERTKELTDLTQKLQQEIETRNHIEKKLAKSENQYRSLFESAAVGHMVADKEGTIIMTNDRMNQLFGYEKHALDGQKVEVLIPEGLRKKHIEHRNAYSHHPKLRTMGEGMELLARKNDGSTFPVEISLNYYYLDDDLMISALVIDISQRKNTERKLAKSENQYRSLFESAAVGHMVADKEGTIVMTNDRMNQLFGYEKHALDGQKVETLIPDTIRKKHIEHRNSYSRHPKLRTMGEGMELLARKNDGSTFPVEISLNYYYLDDDLMISALVIDISQRKNTERKLAESERLFRSVIENSADAVLLADEKLNIHYQSPSVELMDGMSLDERNSDLGQQQTHPEDRSMVTKAIENAMQCPDKAVPFQARLLHRQGHYFWVEGNITNLLGSKGVEAIVFNYRDISTRKKMEDDLVQSEERFRTLIERIADGFVALDKNFCYTYVNRKAGEITKRDPEDLRGKYVWDVFPEAIGSATYHAIQTATRTQEYLHITDYFAPLDLWHESHFYPSPEGVSIFIRDVSERMKAERKLIESEKYFRSLIENISDAIVVNDKDFKLIYQSPSVQRITGYTEEERKGLSIKEYIHPDHQEDFKRIYKLINEQPNEPIDFQYQFLHKDGHYIWIEGVVTNLLNDESVKAIVANYRDITDRKLSEAEIIKLQKKDEANAAQMSAILDALPASIALLNEHGVIVEVNKIWKDFGRANGLAGTHHGIGDNYLAVAKRSVGPDREVAINIARAIEDVLDGKKMSYTTEYPCHAPHEHRWFKMIVTPLSKAGSGAVVMHLNITDQRKSERQLRLSYEALENSMNAFEIVNQEGKHIYVNQAYLSMWGYNSSEEVLGTSPSGRCVDPELPAKIMAILSENKNCKMEYTAKRKDGSTFEALMTGILSVDEEGNTIFIGSVIDITDRKINEEKLKQERTLLRTLIDNLPDYIYVKDKDCRFLINNKADLNLKNLPSEAMAIGKTAVEIFGPEVAQTTHNDDQRVILSGKAMVDHEETTIGNNGERKFLLTTKVPLKDAQNNVVGLVRISRDITKQKQIELDLRNSNYFLETAQAVGKIGHWVSEISRAGKLHWSNETCRIFGINPVEFDGRIETFFEFIHPDDMAGLNAATALAYEGRTAYSIDHRIILKNGLIKWVHEQGEASFDEQGEFGRLIGIVQDITERKEFENQILQLNAELEARVTRRTEQLQAANKEMEAFTYSVSHDLRAPLRIIDGFSQILMEDYIDELDDEGVKTLAIIMSNAKKMGQLIDDLLNFSRIGRIEIKKVKVDMNELVDEVLQELKLGGVQIPEHLRIEHLEPLLCDENLMRHVWINLLSNAIKYSGLKVTPVIEVGMKIENGKSTYFVKDNGAGFDMQYYHKLFGVFQRLHGHQEFSGTGVGLAIVQRIILRHGGTVWAESKVHEGATFYFSFE